MKRRFFSALAVCFFLTVSSGTAFSETGTLIQLDRLLLSGEKGPHAEFITCLEQGVRAYESLENYRAIFYKSERSGKGGLEPREKIFLKFEKPFKVFMRWLNTDKKDLEVLYERGKHHGKLAIHKPGIFFRLKPVIYLDPKSPWVRKGSASYDIEDVGIGTFLYDLCDAAVHAARQKKLQVRVIGDAYEVIFLGPKEDPVYFAHRIIVSFDKVTGLPTHMALYDWDGESMGVYAYEELAVNIGPEDKDLRSMIHPKLYKVYQGR